MSLLSREVNMRQKTYICLLLLVLLSACAPHWIKSGASEQDIARDTVECRSMASGIVGEGTKGPTAPMDSYVWRSNFESCMRGRGYVKR
jgi:hypothetical protein